MQKKEGESIEGFRILESKRINEKILILKKGR